MRIKYTLFNISAGIGNQIVITGLSFFTRTVFIHNLGIEYLGIQGLFTSMLAMLSLAEAGIGSSIVYNLYKPVANNDRTTIQSLMKLYRHAYLVIAGIVVALGLGLLPFLDLFIKDTGVDNLPLIYCLFLISTAAPYLFVYKHAFLNVNQKNFIVTGFFTASSVLTSIAKIAILIYTQNFILYLVSECVISIVTSYFLVLIVDRKYPFLREKSTEKLDPAIKSNLLRNVKAIILQNIGVYFVFGVDSVLISSFISVVAVGLYSNYKMLIETGRTFINQVFSNMYHSVGNLVAQENADTVLRIYKVAWLINFWLYSIVAIIMMLVIEPFIQLWIGSQFLMGETVLIVLIISFYERGMRNTITTVKTTSGIFHEDRYAPLCQAAINLLVSILLVNSMGIAGIFVGTLISSLAVPFWTTPYLVYKKVFHKPLRQYYYRYTYFALIGCVSYSVMYALCSFMPATSFAMLGLQALVSFIVLNAIYIALFYRTEEFSYLWGIGKSFLKNKTFRKSVVDREV